METNMEVKLGASDASATLVFKDEGHTLGNVLRYMLIKDENVTFAGVISLILNNETELDFFFFFSSLDRLHRASSAHA
jgi:hypothetical protein